MENIDVGGVVFKDCAYYANGNEGPFCPVCYPEKDNKLVKMIKKKNMLFEQYFYECPELDCQMKIFPSI